MLLRRAEGAFRVGGDGVAVAEDGVVGELPALQEAGVADGGHEGHLVHGEPFAVADGVGAVAKFGPVAFFPVVEGEELAAAFEEAGAVAVDVDLVEAGERGQVGAGVPVDALVDLVVAEAHSGVGCAFVKVGVEDRGERE